MKEISKEEKIVQAVSKARHTVETCHKLGFGGSSYPGEQALAVYPDILNVVKSGVRTILVSGTNGKTTTTRMISSILDAASVENFSNRSGANLYSGIVTAFVLNADSNGNPIKKTAVIECDELYVPMVATAILPDVIVITSICEDQVDRLGTPENIISILKTVINSGTAKICISDDCPYGKELIKNTEPERIIHFTATGNKCVVDGEVFYPKLTVPADFNFRNAAAAIATVKAFGISADYCINSLEKTKMPFGRFERFFADNKEVIIALVKNSESLNCALEYLMKNGKEYEFVIGINSRVYDGADVSWLKKSDIFKYKEKLKNVSVIGDARETVAEYLETLEIPVKQIMSTEDIFSFISNSRASIAFLLNYTAMMSVRKMFAQAGYIENFWEN